MTTEVHRVQVDPSVEGSESLPEVPEAGLVLVSVPGESVEACGARVLEFARGWRDLGRRVYLCDACFEVPFLHRAAGVENGEGLSDSILYGTSLGRVSHRLEQHIALAPAGTVVGDPSRVRAHPRWSTILSGFAEAGALLVVAVPAGSSAGALGSATVHIDFGSDPRSADASPDVDAAAEETEDVQVSEPEPDILDADVSLLEAEPDVGGFALEAATTVEAELAEPTPVESAPAASSSVRAAPEPNAEEESVYAGEPAEGERLADPPPVEFDEVAGEVIREVRPRSTSPLLLVLLLVVAAVLALGFFGIVEIPGITPADAEAASGLLLHR